MEMATFSGEVYWFAGEGRGGSWCGKEEGWFREVVGMVSMLVGSGMEVEEAVGSAMARIGVERSELVVGDGVEEGLLVLGRRMGTVEALVYVENVAEDPVCGWNGLEHMAGLVKEGSAGEDDLWEISEVSGAIPVEICWGMELQDVRFGGWMGPFGGSMLVFVKRLGQESEVEDNLKTAALMDSMLRLGDVRSKEEAERNRAVRDIIRAEKEEGTKGILHVLFQLAGNGNYDAAGAQVAVGEQLGQLVFWLRELEKEAAESVGQLLELLSRLSSNRTVMETSKEFLKASKPAEVLIFAAEGGPAAAEDGTRGEMAAVADILSDELNSAGWSVGFVSCSSSKDTMPPHARMVRRHDGCEVFRAKSHAGSLRYVVRMTNPPWEAPRSERAALCALFAREALAAIEMEMGVSTASGGNSADGVNSQISSPSSSSSPSGGLAPEQDDRRYPAAIVTCGWVSSHVGPSIRESVEVGVLRGAKVIHIVERNDTGVAPIVERNRLDEIGADGAHPAVDSTLLAVRECDVWGTMDLDRSADEVNELLSAEGIPEPSEGLCMPIGHAMDVRNALTHYQAGRKELLRRHMIGSAHANQLILVVPFFCRPPQNSRDAGQQQEQCRILLETMDEILKTVKSSILLILNYLSHGALEEINPPLSDLGGGLGGTRGSAEDDTRAKMNKMVDRKLTEMRRTYGSPRLMSIPIDLRSAALSCADGALLANATTAFENDLRARGTRTFCVESPESFEREEKTTADEVAQEEEAPSGEPASDAASQKSETAWPSDEGKGSSSLPKFLALMTNGGGRSMTSRAEVVQSTRPLTTVTAAWTGQLGSLLRIAPMLCPAGRDFEEQAVSSESWAFQTTHATRIEFSRIGAKQVHLFGSCNGWVQALTMTDTARDGRFKLKLRLPKGKHYYKLLVDGEWVVDSKSPDEDDSSGFKNNFVVVK